MEKETLIKVTNRSAGSLGYRLPELNVKRKFQYRETKDIPFAELTALYNTEGGETLVKKYLAIKSEEAVKELGFEVEPEYFYVEEDILRVMEKGSQNEFLDMLDFAPDGVLDMVKSLAVSHNLNDMNKREAILDKLGFDVTKAIEISRTPFDGGDSANAEKEEPKVRRTTTTTTRRVVVPAKTEE